MNPSQKKREIKNKKTERIYSKNKHWTNEQTKERTNERIHVRVYARSFQELAFHSRRFTKVSFSFYTAAETETTHASEITGKLPCRNDPLLTPSRLTRARRHFFFFTSTREILLRSRRPSTTFFFSSIRVELTKGR